MVPRNLNSVSCASFLFLLHMLAVVPTGAAQSRPAPPTAAQSPYTLQMNTRLVLTDVTVTDSKGNPVRGLTRGYFHVYDNGHPQRIASFEEHTEQRTPPGEFGKASTSAFSNNFDAHPPPVVNILLIDTTTISLVDQMYLYEQLARFVRDLPPGEPVAVFNRAGPMTLPLQKFTTNKQLLMTAIHEAIPHFRVPGYWYRTEYDTLWQIASYVSQVPGRKNIIWFSGGSNLFLLGALLGPDPSELGYPSRQLYDMLEKLRIALYPIDARGLTVGYPSGMASQQLLMREEAEATGGHAYFNTNGLRQAAQKVLNTDGDYYTLTYAPDDLHQDNKWHKVTVRIAADKRLYHLSYRRGYYDDRRNSATPEPAMRTLLRQDGSTVKVPNDRSQPIVFQAVVRLAGPGLPADIPAKPLKKGQTAYRIHYVLPARSIQPNSVNGNKGTDQIGAAILAVDHYGEPITRVTEEATLQVNEAKIHADPEAKLTFDQQINLPPGEDYLDIGLWDMTTGRVGMLSVPIAVKKTKK